MINLNSKDFAEKGIFNNGAAGLAKNVTLTVERKSPEDKETAPDYKVVISDKLGSINAPFWHFANRDGEDMETRGKRFNREVGRIVHIVRAIMGGDYEFPEFKTEKEAWDGLFKIIRDNAGSKQFNVFVTYGTTSYPKEYLQLRYFNFIEAAKENSKFNR